MIGRVKEIDRVQYEQYVFPYHYIPRELECQDEEYRFSRIWGFSASYIAACKMIDRWIIEENIKGNHLDVGCGSGALLKWLQDRHSSKIKFSGIDQNPEAIKWALMFNEGVNFTVGDIEDVPSSYYDSLTLVEVIEHIPPNELKDFIDHIFRVLTPGGKILVTVPSTFSPLVKKHYQHFDFTSLNGVFEKHMTEIHLSFFDNSPLFIRGLKKLFMNKHWYLEVYFLNKIFVNMAKNKHQSIGGRILMCGQSI